MYETLATPLATASSGGGGSGLLSVGILLLIPFAMYFFMIRPQRRRMRAQQELQRSIEVGDEVITTSGIVGEISGEDGENRFWLEIDDDVHIRIARAAIQGRLDEGDDDVHDEDVEDEDIEDDEVDDEGAELTTGDAARAESADDGDS